MSDTDNGNGPIVPYVAGVFPLLENIGARVHAMFSKKSLDLQLAQSLVQDASAQRLLGLHDLTKPLIQTDAQGRKSLLLVWAHPKDFSDPDFMVAMVCPAARDRDGREIYKPEVVIRGKHANVLIIGGMSCCGGTVQAHVTQISDEGVFDQPLQPTAALAHPEHMFWLKDKLRLADTPQGKAALYEMARAIAHHRRPNDPRFMPRADAPDYLGYARRAAAQVAPAPR